ncbi:MAG: OmpA family protein, partial [Campylobacteraceae bacterium]|nr:OmpA family protein [Campylobacteraceae bacterium]
FILIIFWFLSAFVCIYNELDESLIQNDMKLNERISKTIASVKDSSFFSTFSSDDVEDSKKVEKEIIVKEEISNDINIDDINIIKDEDIITATSAAKNNLLIIQDKLKDTEKNELEISSSIENKEMDKTSVVKEVKMEEKTVDPQEVQEKINLILKTNKISFKRMSTSPTKKSKKTISNIANILKEYKNIKIEVAGHTDSKGKKAFNMNISEQRADSVKKVLISLGIDEKRVSSKGYGESKPLVKNNGGYSILNRRVEFNIIKE